MRGNLKTQAESVENTTMEDSRTKVADFDLQSSPAAVDEMLPGRHSRPDPTGLDPSAWSREAAILVDDRERVIEWCHAATLIFGYTRDEAVGADLAELIIPPSRRSRHTMRFRRLLRVREQDLPREPLKIVARRSGGEEIPIEGRIIRTATEPFNFLILIRDLSGTEPTEAGHRRLEAMVGHSEHAMATLDRDGRVTSWNPAAARLYGHSAEDVVGARLASFLVPEDRREEPPRWLAAIAAGRSVEEETRRLRKDGTAILVSIRMFPVRDVGGRIIGSVWLADDITDRRHRMEIEEGEAEEARRRRRIDHALAEDYFAFAAQPIVDLRSGEVYRHELLLRMRTGTGEVVGPGDLIPVAERSGQIVAIDTWAARRGIGLAARFPVAINLSARGIADPALIVTIEEEFRKTGVDPTRVTFEVTETAAAEDIDAAVELVGRLRALGCGVALDDFGTGFASLTYLKRLDVTELKIDREFVAGALGNEADQRVIRTIVSIARNFHLGTVAEGIEENATRQLLSSMGVDLAQGYLFGRPRLLEVGIDMAMSRSEKDAP